ncbi:MAG: S-layer homology domain-containing protein, partial [Evtepia sp.]
VSELSSLLPGETVDFDIVCADSRWNHVTQALGAMDRILIDGAVPTGLSTSPAPRTAIGVKADGTVLFYTIDGRQKGLSIGASLTQVGTRLAELGCMNAVALDGGGSTSLGITALDQGVFSLINSPSDGKARAVTNALFLVSGTAPTGTPGSVYIAPPRTMILNNSSFRFTASMVDSGYYPMDSTGTTFTWSALHGSITADGQYTAPPTGGYDEITATAHGVSGMVGVQLVPTPDILNILDQATKSPLKSLNLAAEQIVDLTATASYRTLALAAQDTSFTWKLDPAVGTITPEGVMTAAKTSASGSLTVSAGSRSVSIPVTVTAVIDTTPPTITLTSENGTVRATITENSSSAFTAEQLTLSLDGNAIPFTWDGTALTATLPTLSNSLHRLTATAIDESGNLGRTSLTLNSDQTYPTPFVDMSGHWAESYTTYLNQLGVISGMESKEGLIFQPNQSITRGDFALMTARFMNLNPDDFSAVILPFSDIAQIPNWSLNAVKAMYDKGIMKGSQINGQLCANANANISRAEAMTILGRIQPAGYPKAALDAYKDAATIPVFAQPYMQVLISLQVVSGSDGFLRPSDPVSRSEVSKMLFTLR